jgi:hypothetical protein
MLKNPHTRTQSRDTELSGPAENRKHAHYYKYQINYRGLNHAGKTERKMTSGVN